MSVASELTALEGFMTSAYSKISDKGGNIPQNKNMQNLTNAIDSIPTGSIIIIPPDAGTLTSISVTSNPTKTVYNEGEYFDFSGLVITATYSSGQQFDVTNSCTYTMNQPLQYGDSSIPVTYETATTTISITVNAIPVPAPATTVALYHFNTSLKNEVTGNNATNQGTIQYLTGKFANGVCAKSLVLTETYNISNSDLQNGNYTFEFWVKAPSNYTSDTSYYTQLVKGGLLIFQNSNVRTAGLLLNSEFASSSTADTTFPNFNTHNWNHIAVVITSGTYKVFLNGTLASHGNVRVSSGNDLNRFFFGPSTQVAYTNDFVFDEFLLCTSAKYTNNFTPNIAPYYLQS